MLVQRVNPVPLHFHDGSPIQEWKAVFRHTGVRLCETKHVSGDRQQDDHQEQH